MSAHVGVLGLWLIRQRFIILRHEEAINISSNCDILDCLSSVWWSYTCPFYVYDKACLRTLFDRTLVYAESNERVKDKLLSFELGESSLWVWMYLLAQRNHLVNITSSLRHCCDMCLPLLCEINFAWPGELARSCLLVRFFWNSLLLLWWSSFHFAHWMWFTHFLTILLF